MHQTANMKSVSFIVFTSLTICSFTGTGKEHAANDYRPYQELPGYERPAPGWTSLFNGKDLTGWDTYLGPESDSNGKRISDQPIGLNKDPRHVFSVVKDGADGASAAGAGENVIRISGEGV